MGRQNIQEIWLKCKAALDAGIGEWGLFLLIILALLAAFGLGRLSVLIEPKPLIEPHTALSGDPMPMAPGGQYVASRTGSVYYFPWCSGAEKIATQNERWFPTEIAAQAAGYRPAKNCKGLVGE
jgi:hypothetical protein